MIVLPTFDNYESIDLNEMKIYKNTLGSSIKEIIGIGVSGKTKNELNVVFKNYITNFRFLNDWKASFDKVLKDLTLGVDATQSFFELIERKKMFSSVSEHMRASALELKLLSDKGMKYLKKKGYQDIFPNDYKAYTSQANIKAFNAFDNMIETIYSFYSQNMTVKGVDPWRFLASNLEIIEENFESIFNNLLSEISLIQDPKEARKIVSKSTKYLWKDVFPKREGDTDKGIKILFTLGYEKNIYYKDIISLYTTMMTPIVEYMNEINPLLTTFPNLQEYYKPQFESIEGFLQKHLTYILSTIQKLFPYYIDTYDAKSTYNDLIDESYHPKKYNDQIKKYKEWFYNIGKQVEKKIEDLEKKKESDIADAKLEKYIKTREKIQKIMKEAEQLSHIDKYKNSRKQLKTLIKDLEDLETEKAKNMINEIKEELIKTKPKKKEIERKHYILHIFEYNSIKNLIKYLEQAIEEKDYYKVKSYKESIKKALEKFEEEVNEFEGDIVQLKKIDLYIDIVQKANDSLKMEIPGGKSEEAFKLEENGIPLINAYFPSIDNYANIPPNRIMIPSVMMVKTNILNELNKMRPFTNESEKLKKCVEDADNKLKILDEYIAKCSSSPEPGK